MSLITEKILAHNNQLIGIIVQTFDEETNELIDERIWNAYKPSEVEFHKDKVASYWADRLELLDKLLYKGPLSLQERQAEIEREYGEYIMNK